MEDTKPVTKKICKHFLERKKRPCKFEVYKNSEYCSHHYNLADNGTEATVTSQKDGIFIPCPLDPNHHVLQSNLEKHLQICPKVKYQRQLEQSVWYKKDINLPSYLKAKEGESANLNTSAISLENEGPTEENKETANKGQAASSTNNIDDDKEEDEKCKKNSKHYLQALAKDNPEQYKALLTTIEQAFKKALELYHASLSSQENISGLSIDTLASEEYLLDMATHVKEVDTTISDTQKNQKQCEDLVRTLGNFGLLTKEACYVEYGAGKGALSHYIANTVKECDNILIELESRRHKLDKNHRLERNFHRLRGNIKDFDINALPQIIDEEAKGPNKKEKPAAYNNEPILEENKVTEEQEAIRKLVRGEARRKEDFVGVSKHMCGLASDLTFFSILNAHKPVEALGFMIATCCHHRCTEEMYLNPEWLGKLGVASELQKGFLYASSWAIFRQNNEKRPNVNKDATEKEVVEKEENSFKKGVELDSDEKTVLGLRVKRVLDIGRVLCMREKGFNCFMVKYCEKTYSPENFVIIGRRSENQGNDK